MGRRPAQKSFTRIVSFRVNNEEFQELERWSSISGLSLSTMLRRLFTQMKNPFSGDRVVNEKME